MIGLSVRAMVESAVRSGYPVTALDAFGDQDLRRLAESRSLHHDFHAGYSPEALYQASRGLSFDAVAYTSSFENHPEILDKLEEQHQILGNSSGVVRSVRDWIRFFAALKSAGFQTPETSFKRMPPDAKKRWLVKPVLSGGGHGIDFLDETKTIPHGFMLQEYISGKSCSAAFIANGKKAVVIGITEQLIGIHQLGSCGFRYCGNILPLPELLDPAAGRKIIDTVQQLADFIVREYGLTGVNGIDFILKGDRVWPTEVNPRYSASMELIEKAYGLPVVHSHVQSVLEEKLPAFNLNSRVNQNKYFGKGILFAEKDSIIYDTQSWFDRDIHDIPASGELLRKGNPVCTICISRPGYQETFNGIIEEAAVLRNEIEGVEGF
jgi:uncharacterized protein